MNGQHCLHSSSEIVGHRLSSVVDVHRVGPSFNAHYGRCVLAWFPRAVRVRLKEVLVQLKDKNNVILSNWKQ